MDRECTSGESLGHLWGEGVTQIVKCATGGALSHLGLKCELTR